jgi:hypothetical protein
MDNLYFFRSLHLNPKKTFLICQEIVSRWPVDGSLPLPPSPPERERVRELIRRAVLGSDIYRPDALLAAIMATDPTEDRTWRSHAVNVLAALPRPLSFEPLYVLYQHDYHHVALRNAVSGQYVRLENKSFNENDALAVFGENPVDGLVVAAFRYRHSIPRLIEHFRLQRSAPLAIHAAYACYQAAIRNPLGELEKPWLLGHSLPEAITALETHLTTNQEQGGFLAALVRVYGALSWKYKEVADHPFLPKFFERVTQKDMLGKPDERPDVWKFDREVAALVRRWLNDEKIKSFFDSVDAVPARKIFWRRTVPVIEEIHSFPACNGFAMKIGPIWFMEFGEHGNACYPYSDNDYQILRLNWGRMSYQMKEKTDSLKEKWRLYDPPSSYYYHGYKEYKVGDGRLPHSPTWNDWDPGWHRKFEAYIETFCGVTLE